MCDGVLDGWPGCGKFGLGVLGWCSLLCFLGSAMFCGLRGVFNDNPPCWDAYLSLLWKVSKGNFWDVHSLPNWSMSVVGVT